MADLNATLAERGSRYGDFTDHARIAQRLQDVMHRSGAAGLDMAVNKGWHALSPVQKQALTVIADKIACILSGDPNYTDNWHDIQGYAKLAEDRCVDTTSPQLPFGVHPEDASETPYPPPNANFYTGDDAVFHPVEDKMHETGERSGS